MYTDQSQEGDSLEYWIGDLLGIEDDLLIEALANEASSLSHREYQDGGEPLFDTEISYVRVRPSTTRIQMLWRDFEESIHHRSRFFNAEAKLFLQTLFADISNLHAIKPPDWPPLPAISEFMFETTGAIRTLEPSIEFPIYRARRVDGEREFKKFYAATARELGPAPPHLAGAGRMNAEGVPVFYGSSDRDTCVSELRPHIDSMIASAEFRLTRPVVVLDFRVLENSFSESPLSIFDPEYQNDSELRLFLKTLHRMVREPIRPGAEKLYLRTQVMAEFLATQHEPPIEGVLFSSAQRAEGSNLVLFPHKLKPDLTTPKPLFELDVENFEMEDIFKLTAAYNSMEPVDDSLVRFPLAFVENSLRLHTVGEIKYGIKDFDTYQGEIQRYEDDIDEEY